MISLADLYFFILKLCNFYNKIKIFLKSNISYIDIIKILFHVLEYQKNAKRKRADTESIIEKHRDSLKQLMHQIRF